MPEKHSTISIQASFLLVLAFVVTLIFQATLCCAEVVSVKISQDIQSATIGLPRSLAGVPLVQQIETLMPRLGVTAATGLWELRAGFHSAAISNSNAIDPITGASVPLNEQWRDQLLADGYTINSLLNRETLSGYDLAIAYAVSRSQRHALKIGLGFASQTTGTFYSLDVIDPDAYAPGISGNIILDNDIKERSRSLHGFMEADIPLTERLTLRGSYAYIPGHSLQRETETLMRLDGVPVYADSSSSPVPINGHRAGAGLEYRYDDVWSLRAGYQSQILHRLDTSVPDYSVTGFYLGAAFNF